ncbi:MAG: hypothetical protein JSR46_06970 [Verrucomicrobia bacterium]|nr:hypothetical protein [Verrucomicrobiota bacterium]
MRIESVNSFLSSSPIWDSSFVHSVGRSEGEKTAVVRAGAGSNKEMSWLPLVDTCSRAEQTQQPAAAPLISQLSADESNRLQKQIAHKVLMLNLLKV